MNDNIFKNPKLAFRKLVTGNNLYVNANHNPADISRERRNEAVQNCQAPYAAIIACSDSRVPPEHIFSAGIGDLFVVRTAGNIVGDFEIGSIEFAVKCLHVPIVVIMGHTHCAAVSAALTGNTDGYMNTIIYEIQSGLGGAVTESEAVYNNILHSKQRVFRSKAVNLMVETGHLIVVCAEYDMQTGNVNFFDIDEQHF